ncbi:hypothetical protein LJR153_000603 [Paenibacillus sp. LjRoot153]|uniref:hypothetical protein n=1 Tax=Paenibacillus sp. LjRoot153 TaxID=3342270 RepID=UPI003ED02189
MFQASNDGTNWVTLSQESNVTSWQVGVTKSFVFNNEVTYTKYRILVLANNGSPDFITIGEMELLSQ